jgi:ribosomal protein L37E
MSARGKKTENPISRALQAAKEGVEFFERAHIVANEPRVREVFGRLLDTKKESLRSLEENLKEARLQPPEAEGKLPRIYPLEELQKKECYVCGYGTDSETIPESCPRCGASRYAFQKEITLEKAWEMAESGSRVTLEILSEAEREAEAKVKPVLAKQIQLEQRILNETRKELESQRKS